MILGFTGTRNPITDQQRDVLCEWIDRATVLHHGACVNADEESHEAALAANLDLIVVHPPVDTRLMMTPDWNHPNVEVRQHLPYHRRNRNIVNASTCLLALPDGPWKPFGGTWYCVDFASGRKDSFALHRVIPVTICYPDGEIEER